MKKFIFLITILLVTSCTKNKDEQMFHDYQQKKVALLNFELKDLDFKIQNLEKIKDITSADSIKHLKLELAEHWTKNPDSKLVDTISFEHVKNVLNESIDQADTLYKGYQELVLMAIRSNSIARKYKYQRQRDDAKDEMFSYKKILGEVEQLEGYFNSLKTAPDSLLAAKYIATYSLNNPMLGNTKQTFTKYYYTNATQSKFIKEEDTINKK